MDILDHCTNRVLRSQILKKSNVNFLMMTNINKNLTNKNGIYALSYDYICTK